jgi:ribonucleoside-diphosphate reductase alpha chain
MSLAPERLSIGLRRLFTSPGVDPYDEVVWERRDARITNFKDGVVAFEQTGVEFPLSWSQNATNIVAQKYFRGTVGTPEREDSLRQVIDRVVDTITTWGREGGYFADDAEADAFSAELKYILVTQRAAFNSPVWFNIGVKGVPQQASACFILSVDDTMDSILNWYREEGVIFKGGSGAGVNLSKIRSSVELLEGGGTASGPVSFMRGADASAGTIKSGGKTRRAAKMVILDVDHPDIEEFVWCKVKEERKARVLRDAGFDMDLDGADSYSIQYQNANNSVRVTDEFMQAVRDDAEWGLVAVTTGEVVRRVRARDLWRQIAEAAWDCADPGIQFDTTINTWHTAHTTGRINASNPCFTGDTLVHTDKGLIRFAELFDRANRGEEFDVYTHDITNPDEPAQVTRLTTPEAFMITGRNPIVRLRFDNGMELRCTPGHRLFTINRGYVEAGELTADDQVRSLDLPTPAVNAEWSVPASPDVADYHAKGDHRGELNLPEEWTTEFAHYLGWLIGDGTTSTASTTTIYGSAEDRDEVLPIHQRLIEQINGGRSLKVSEQANGTAQLRLSRRAFKRYVEALGVRSVTGEHKVVPWSIEQAPTEVAAAFLRGLFDADGCIVNTESQSYVGLGSISPELLRGVQRLLTTFGITSRIYNANPPGRSQFTYTRADGSTAEYQRRASYDLRITGRSLERFAGEIGFGLLRKQSALQLTVVDRVRPYAETDKGIRLVERTDDGVELTYNLTEPTNHSYVANGVITRNCSEYMHLDNSACNLASINLLKYLSDDASFDVDAYMHTIEIVFTAQEILVGRADYPTPSIGETSRQFRQLGLGYANLGALLMALGHPYDSADGRAWAASLTSLMTGHAYATSARTASRMGPFAGYADNEEHMLRVLRMHRDAAYQLDHPDAVPAELLAASQHAWETAVGDGEEFGVRNSQATVIAPTGTIGLMMDCDTTGIEPDLGLVKMKKLVGGGTMSIVNRTVPRALARLGYQPPQVDEIVAYIDEHKSIVGAPHLIPVHLAVFACSMGDNTIHYEGHVRMMGAVQPFLSGSISKCVTGETLLPTENGLIRISSLRRGEAPDTFRDEILEIDSLGGRQKTGAFYYGGARAVREVVLRSGHKVTGTGNHRVLVVTEGGFDWRRLDEIAPGDLVATKYGADVWSSFPARFDDFVPTPSYGCQKDVRLPEEMTEELAFLLGAYAAEGSTVRSTYTIRITNSVPSVRQRVVDAWRASFGLEAKIVDDGVRCPDVVLSSKTVVEFFESLGCGVRAATKRIPDAVLRSPRHMVLSFLDGLSLDAYASVSTMPKWAICLDSPRMLDDLQAVLTNLGVVHGRISKYNPQYDKYYDELYATGESAKRLCALVPFLEPDKAARANELMSLPFARRNSADVIPLAPVQLHAMLPVDLPPQARTDFAFLLDKRTRWVSRRSVERAIVAGAAVPPWVRQLIDDDLHLSPVVTADDGGMREVYDVSVPANQAFVGNGIVNHNTVNMPEDVTVEDVEGLHELSWELGLKSVAIYRDNCKVGQPLSTAKKEPAAAGAPAVVTEIVEKVIEVEKIVNQPVRRKLSRSRRARTFEFRVADCKGFATIGEYDSGQPGEIFLTVSKQGSTMSGIMDAFAKSISYGLQYGVPLRAFVEAFTNMRFEPAGMTDDPDIRFATSVMDYLFRRLALEYLSYDERAELGIFSVDERLQPTLPGVEETAIETSAGSEFVPDPKSVPSAGELVEQIEQGVLPATPEDNTDARGVVRATDASAAPAPELQTSDAPLCMQCGVQMIRAGSCHACPSCGSTSGCS